MALVEFENFSFRYPKQKNTLSNINLDVSPGEFVLLCGPSGSGKTTLLANIKNEIKPVGDSEGTIYYDGVDIRNLEEKRSASEIGFLFQNPEDQFVSDNVLQEIAFSLENMGLSTGEIRNRVAEMAAFFGLDKHLYRNVSELSGGQKQLVNLCSLLVLKPKLLLLDEPTSQLDPIAAYDFLSILRRLNEEFSITIMATEHKIDNLFPFIDKAVFLEDGFIKYRDEPRRVCSEAWKNDIFRNYLPSVTRIHFLLQSKYQSPNKVEIPLNIREGRRYLSLLNNQLEEIPRAQLNGGLKLNEALNSQNSLDKHSKVLMECKDVWFGYLKEHIVLEGIFLQVKQGEFLSMLGGNGTGKTTLLQILSGLLKPQKGKVIHGKDLTLGYVHQNPLIHFHQETVEEELMELSAEFPEDKSRSTGFLGFLSEHSSSKKATSSVNLRIFSGDRSVFEHEREELIDLFGLSELLGKHPYDCSGGEQQKIAITKALLTNPDILFLDEPTKGIDPMSKLHLADKLKKLQEKGLTIVMTTHDIEFAAEYTERCVLLFDGGLQVDDTPKSVFSNNNFYTTFVNRMVKDYLPDCITLEDVKEQWMI